MMTFNAYAFFERLLHEIEHEAATRDLLATLAQTDGFLTLARSGFDNQHKNVAWDERYESSLRDAARDDYGLDRLAGYGEFAPGVCAFAAYSLGAMAAWRLAGDFGYAESFAAAALLPGFLVNERDAVCRAVSAFSM